MRKLFQLLFVVCFCLVPVSATVIVDPDAAAPGTDISNFFPGVTLTALGTGYGSGPSVFAVDPRRFTPSTGLLSFGTNNATFPELWREPGFLTMKAAFSPGATQVWLDFIADDSFELVEMQVYNSANVLLATVQGMLSAADAVITLTYSDPNIAYIIAGGSDDGSAVGLDNLRYDPVPEPGTWVLLSSGLAAVAFLRRRA